MGSKDLAVRTSPEGTEYHRRRGRIPRGNVEPLWLGMRRVSEHLFEYQNPYLGESNRPAPLPS